jgi:signal transduction histidine kinase/DNA-binding response OmpR family regulator
LFLLNASCKIDDKIVFGSDKGLIYFTPENIKQTFYEKNLVLTDIKLFNKSIHSNQQNSLLKKNISFTKEIDLKYNQNYLTFEFSSLNYKRESDIQYSCKLEGLETEWNDIGDENKITYTNLTHGSYDFKVKAYDSGMHSNFEEVSIKVKIHPPFWKTTIAYILYYILLSFSLYKLYNYFLRQEKRKSALALERLDAKKKHEIDLMKLRFFMNVSHEFRTPLTLLSAPLDTLMKDVANPEKRKTYYQLMHQNVQRLKRLIDELLELRKIDAGFLKMEWKLGNFIEFSRSIFETFQNYAEKRNMKFTFSTDIKELNIYFDADKLDKVLFNLISNAFKYTENGGVIEIMVTKQSAAVLPAPVKSYIEVSIKDTGVGISKEAVNNIFQRFHSTENNRPIDSASTGIGLSLAKELVELHNGRIEVESIENQGSIFRIILPVYNRNPHESENYHESDIKNIEINRKNNTSEISDNFEHDKGKNLKPLLQIVEDNEDLRVFLETELSDEYEIIHCINGEEGLTIAKTRIPDLIISDIMMDKMDGISMCKKIKSDEKTSHIPIILLTARHAQNSKLDGYQIGADDYITKPFNVELLKTRIQNLIQQRKKLRAKYSLGLDNLNEIDIEESLDSKFINKLNNLIIDNIANEDLDPSYLASELAMSRMQLYRKVNALTGQTVNIYIKTIRLNRAAQLLLTTDFQIAEIAYKVGYSEPSNFTKSFGKHFNQTPSQFVSANKK